MHNQSRQLHRLSFRTATKPAPDWTAGAPLADLRVDQLAGRFTSSDLRIRLGQEWVTLSAALDEAGHPPPIF
jgi:hypothetical protein